jgi:hypothetical protein
VTLDIGVLEEAAHIGVAVFQKVLLPLCGVNNFVIIGISTPQDESNYYSRLLDLKDHDGRPFFVALRIEQACAKCIQNNKAASCEHMQHLLPPWKSAERSRKMAAVYSNDVNSFVQENQGVVLNSSKTYIFRDYIKTFLANPPYIFDKRPSVIFVAIDPSGGGSQSQYACVALAIEGQYNVVRTSRLEETVGLHHHQVVVVYARALALQKVSQRTTQSFESTSLVWNLGWRRVRLGVGLERGRPREGL